ncbi:MAG: CD1375 family protein [Clostridium sp.]|uniref:CD1375 family protein n=1 Tax=Clostridium sp. TaxID=1506 RepID=UPI003D6CC7DE
MKDYLIKAYGYLVKVNVWDLEPVEASTKKVVPENYRGSVALYLATGEIVAI